MRIIDWKQLKELQPYSRQHIARLEKAGKWPKRVRLGQNRVGWVFDEIEAKLTELAALRDVPNDTPE
jgi:prophage regulatory protein